MTKQEIRRKMLEKRNNLSRSWVINRSRKIHKRLVATKEFHQAKIIMFYIAKDNEVETKPVIELALRQGKTVCLPCTDRINHRLYPAIIKDVERDLKRGNYGILEPIDKTLTPERIDLIVTPGVAFDINGYRLGRGKGYYDRFLESTGNTPKIGLAFEFQIVKRLPLDKHDVPMDRIITDRRII